MKFLKALLTKHDPEPQINNRTVKWQEVSKQVEEVNPQLAKIINELDPKLDLLLKDASYGALIANYKTKAEAFIILNKSCELFFNYEDRLIPYRIYQAGDICFPELLFDQNPWFYENSLWQLTSGCHSSFMLPNISDYKKHDDLIHDYQIGVTKPIVLADHSKIFTAIANSPILKHPWQSSLLCFTEEWQKYKNEPAWRAFYQYLSESVIKQTELQRQKPLIEMLFGAIQNEKSFKITLFQAEQVQHLLMLSLGGIPAFKPADEHMLPAKIIQYAYLNHYNLKEYVPTIMAPAYFRGESEPIYYSLNYQSSYFLSPRDNQQKTLIKEMQGIHWLLDKVKGFILTKKIITENSKLYQLMQNLQFNFYHPDANKKTYSEFLLPETIAKYDARFLKNWKNHQLHHHNIFFSGCISLANKAKG